MSRVNRVYKTRGFSMLKNAETVEAELLEVVQRFQLSEDPGEFALASVLKNRLLLSGVGVDKVSIIRDSLQELERAITKFTDDWRNIVGP